MFDPQPKGRQSSRPSVSFQCDACGSCRQPGDPEAPARAQGLRQLPRHLMRQPMGVERSRASFFLFSFLSFVFLFLEDLSRRSLRLWLSKPCWDPILGIGCTTFFGGGVDFRGDWDVHWGYALLTHGQAPRSPERKFHAVGECDRVVIRRTRTFGPSMEIPKCPVLKAAFCPTIPHILTGWISERGSEAETLKCSKDFFPLGVG